MTLSKRKIEKIIDYWTKRLKINQIASILNLSRNTVKKYLRERLGYSYQPIRYPSYISSQRSQSQVNYPPFGGNQWSCTEFRHDNPAYYNQPEGKSPYFIPLSEYNQLMKTYIILEQWLMRLIEK